MIKTLLKKSACAVAAVILLAGCAIYQSHPNLPSRDTVTPGQTVTVQGNQNIYAVAREHNVSMRDIIVLNNLQPPFVLRPGQQLTLPSGASGGGGTSYSPTNRGGDYRNGVAPIPSSSPSPEIETAPLPPVDNKPVSSAPLSAPSKQSYVLTSPSGQSQPKTPASVQPQALPPVPTAPVEALNKPTAPAKPVATTITPPPAAVPIAPSSSENVTPPSVTMVWPVQGPILSSFGAKGQGLNNDGINIGAPKGAPVVASSNGIVVYAGNEMKGFGNLVLIRHQDGWVTAYAHLDRMLVAKDAVVAQGDEIGTVGKTGNVPSAQLHFETRYQGKPVDPASIIKAP